MARILRGDVVWADLNPVISHEQAGMRPVLVISRAAFNDRSGTVIAIPITSQPGRAGFPLTMEVTTTKLPKRSWAKISQVQTLSTERIGKRLGRLESDEVNQIVIGLNEIIAESDR
jgi:mRNA interferase MazF